MSTSDSSGAARALASQPLDDLLLAHALEACIRAERARPGSSADIIAHAPAASRADLQRMLALADRLQLSVVDVGPSPRFRAAARARLMARIDGQAARSPVQLRALHASSPGPRRRTRRWTIRLGAGLIAAAVACAATLTASASALPGDALYGLKQVQEELNLRLASDDQARVLVHLRRADARLDETARLLQQGRTTEAVETAQRYDQSVERATTTFVVNADFGTAPLARVDHLESKLGEQQQRLEAILESAPEPALPDLREALATTERGRELVADPRPIERALGLRTSRPPAAAAPVVAEPPAPTEEPEPTVEATQALVIALQPTLAPTRRPTTVPATPTAPAVAPSPTPAAELAERGDDADAVARTDRSGSNRGGVSSSAGGSGQGRGSGPAQNGGATQVGGRPVSTSTAPGDDEHDNAAQSEDERGPSTEAVAQHQPAPEADTSPDTETRPFDANRARSQNGPEREVRVASTAVAPVPATEARTGGGSAGTGNTSGQNGREATARQNPPAVQQSQPVNQQNGRADDRAVRPASVSGASVAGTSSGGSANKPQPTPTATATPTRRTGGSDQRTGNGSDSRSNNGNGNGNGNDDSSKHGGGDDH